MQLGVYHQDRHIDEAVSLAGHCGADHITLAERRFGNTTSLHRTEKNKRRRTTGGCHRQFQGCVELLGTVIHRRLGNERASTPSERISNSERSMNTGVAHMNKNMLADKYFEYPHRKSSSSQAFLFPFQGGDIRSHVKGCWVGMWLRKRFGTLSCLYRVVSYDGNNFHSYAYQK
ncbi:hypothetical protein CHS0354_037161 [Potamilus streckersoni]|uniref:Uncharacterized protein n=1 Tax=Potamilus streckersoni TaxID=2493646 RepID=A0AAE0SWV0_9BIVA|nr:hypothetical protein CHS0354_037161 [Potamilus streckersoni]